jgi:2-amino-4-hydroxy-6-hydroxymethyldihydropteridine diphosphokinase
VDPRVGEVILGLGSNEGDRVRNLERALGRLSLEVRLEEISSTYETEPVGVRDQPWFLNVVCTGVTRLSPRGVLELARTIETGMGRAPGPRFGPRPIDVDLLAYEDRVIEEPDLEVPHPRMTERRFVLEPLVEVAPDWRHPVDGRGARELLADLDDESVVRPYGPPPRPAEAGPLT